MKTIMNELETITRQGYDFVRVFEDWLILMTSALCQDEEEYMKIMGRYRNEGERGSRPADYFANAFGALMLAYQEKPHDYLGDIFTYHVTRGENGQFFTPDSVCELMVRMTIPEIQDGQSVCDPACGSGRMLIKATEKNRYGQFYGVDVDRRCAMMTALNLCFRNVAGAVIWGNTLSLECWGGYGLGRSTIGGAMRKITAEESKALLVTRLPNLDTKSELDENTGDQLVLF
ncbi:MAG: N-6 DNA methylase [Pseudomonadota bacterium]